jgi:hypothetical protein
MLKIKKAFSEVVVIAFSVLFLLAACTPPKPAQQFTLRIGILTTQDLLPYFVMQEQGFAKRHGLQFVETSYPGGGPIIETITNGVVWFTNPAAEALWGHKAEELRGQLFGFPAVAGETTREANKTKTPTRKHSPISDELGQ